MLLMRSCSFSYFDSNWRISLSSMSNLCQGIQSAATERTRERTSMVTPAQFSQAQLGDFSFDLLLYSGSAGGLIIDSSRSIIVLSAGMQQSGKRRKIIFYRSGLVSIREKLTSFDRVQTSHSVYTTGLARALSDWEIHSVPVCCL